MWQSVFSISLSVLAIVISLLVLINTIRNSVPWKLPMQMPDPIADVLEDIEAELPKMKWEKISNEEVVPYLGRGERWLVQIVGYGDQYVATAMALYANPRFNIVKLTPEYVEKALQFAKEST